MAMTATVVKVKEGSLKVKENAFFLTEQGDKDHINYSNGEQRLFDLMPKDGSKISSTDLTHLRQKKHKNWDPENPYNTVNVTMNSLMDKIDRNNEPFILLKTPQRGPRPVEFWLELLDPKQRSLAKREARREKERG